MTNNIAKTNPKNSPQSSLNIEGFMMNIADKSKSSVKLPSMTREATIVKIKGKKADVKLKMPVGEITGYNFPILYPNCKFTGKDSEGKTITLTPKLNLKPKDTVFVAFLGGNFDEGIIIGKK